MDSGDSGSGEDDEDDEEEEGDDEQSESLEEEDDADGDANDENAPINPSSINLLLKGRNFVAAKKAADLGTATVVAHNKKALNSAIWEVVRPHCSGWGFCNAAIANRIIKKKPNNWDTEDWPPAEDSPHANEYYAITLHKRPCFWEREDVSKEGVITDKTVKRWNGKTIVININMYGAKVSSKEDWSGYEAAILQPAQSDRAGAPAESVTQSILKRLHEQHGSFLEANPSAWRVWAADIASHPNGDHDRLIETGVPSTHAALLFKTKDVATEVARQAKTSALNRSAVKTYRKQQEILKLSVKNLVELAATFQRQAIVLQTQIDAFDVALDAFEDIDQAISEESRPVLVPESRELRREHDAPDDQH